jgi:hypothetical protein
MRLRLREPVRLIRAAVASVAGVGNERGGDEEKKIERQYEEGEPGQAEQGRR